jgi:Zn-dependent protease/CBS domain-containing protein
MFGKGIKLFSLFGFEVKIDLSWIILAFLIAWSLAVGLFPVHYKDLPVQTYWFMGAAGALGLFLSIVFHEMCHSLVARRFGIPMKGITLFIFGGVAEMGEEPPSAKAEFAMAVVGPVSSIFIGLVFLLIYVQGKHWEWPIAYNGILQYLGWINFLLAGFNLIPAFPLDGGRVLRSILWGIKKNLRSATRISSRIGSGFGILLILLGAIQFFRGNFIGGIWWFLIGMFLHNAARTSYQQLLIRRALEGEPVRKFMQPNPITVPPNLTVQALVDDYVYKYHFKMFPIVKEPNKLFGCVTTKQIKEIPREEWPLKSVAELATQCSPENTIGPQADSMKALSLMSRTGASRLLVVEGDHLVGIITLKDMLKFLSLKVELEGGSQSVDLG